MRPAQTPLGRSVPLKEKPSYYFQRQCWISADPDERALPYLIEFLGPDKFFWATDYPHDDHTLGYIKELDTLWHPCRTVHDAGFSVRMWLGCMAYRSKVTRTKD